MANKNDIRQFHREEANYEHKVAMNLHIDTFKELIKEEPVPTGIKNQFCRISLNVINNAEETPYLSDIKSDTLLQVIAMINSMKKSKTKTFVEQYPNISNNALFDEFEQLEQNIIAEGCREPLIIWDGIIVDGHNRYEICNKHGIEFKTVEKAFDDKNSAKEWIIRNQFGRRNLTPYQRTSLALTLKDVIEARAKENQGTRTDIHQNSDECIEPINTKKELAKIAGVSHDTVRSI